MSSDYPMSRCSRSIRAGCMVVKCRDALDVDGAPAPPLAPPRGSAADRELEVPGSADVLARETLSGEAGEIDPPGGGLPRRPGNHESLPLHLASAAGPACRADAVLGLHIVAHD